MIAPHIPGKVTDQDNFILAGIASAIKLYDEQGVDYGILVLLGDPLP